MIDEPDNLGQILKEEFGITGELWRDCLSEHRKTSVSLVRILTLKGLISEESLLTVLSKHLDIPYIIIKADTIDSELARKIPSRLVTHYSFMPIKLEDDRIQIAINDPLEISALDEIRLFLNQEIQPVIAGYKDILESIKKFYGVGAETLEAMGLQAPQDLTLLTPEKDIQDETIDPSVIKFLNQVLLDAIKQHSTDIHFEPFEDDLRIRYRIDGILYEAPCPPTIKHFQPQIASRIKVMANLDIAEKRRPQDGRVDIKLEGEVFDLRISIIPTPFGESIDIRILPRSKPLIDLEVLGLIPSELEILDKMIRKPHGIILVTGPTGSGKTTTLYASLNKINSMERKIITIEDPIEYQLKGVTQTQVDTKIGFTFANALRSMLRHDPNVMMVGEIRDTETAELAVRTALTGHLVFSTLHTNDAAGGITRLLDMGIESFLVSSSVILIIAQRLVRLVCAHCKEEYSPENELIKQFVTDKPPGSVFFHGAGCETCRFTGYKGRTGIFEMMEISDEIREMVLKRIPSHQIKERAVVSGMKTLKAVGWDKVKNGLTTMEEVLRVTQEE
jgi:type II secretory ATPase GspE/PulE/Tfp pilus assembly ATPase PilB-like protein